MNTLNASALTQPQVLSQVSRETAVQSRSAEELAHCSERSSGQRERTGRYCL